MKNAKVKSAKRSFFMSVLSLILCFAMLLGTTWAWFTDSVTSGVNQIKAGNLDVELEHTSASVTAAESVATKTNLFTDKNGNAMLWEPGAMSYENFAVKNVGTLAFKYNMSMNVVDFNNLEGHNLTEVLKVKVLTGDAILANPTRESVAAMEWTGAQSLEAFKKDGGQLYPTTQKDPTHPDEEKFQVIVYWQPGQNDNLWNANNGKHTSDGQPLFVNFGVNLVATQLQHEYDSFDNTYDGDATLAPLPERLNGSAKSGGIRKISGDTEKVNVTPDGAASGTAETAVSIEIKKETESGSGSATKTVSSASVPAPAAIKVMEDVFGNNEKFTQTADPTLNQSQDDVMVLTLKVDTVDAQPAAIKVDVKLLQESVRTITNSTTQEVVATMNDSGAVTVLDQPVTVEMQLDPGLTDVKVTHTHENETKPFNSVDDLGSVTDGKFYYEKATGKLTLATTKFSEFDITFTRPAVCRIGNTPYGTLVDALKAAQAGDTVVLLSDITVTSVILKDITVDANGHKITRGSEVLENFVGNILALAYFTGGSGTEEDPYLIASGTQLKNIYSYLSAYQGTYTCFKQTADILNFTAYGNTSYYYFVGEYDGGGHKITPASTVDKKMYLFDLYYGETTIKNLDLYSTSKAPVSLAYSTYYCDKLTLENINFKTMEADETIHINEGNFGFVTCNPINDQRVNPAHGQVFDFTNVNNYVNVENIGNCTAAYFGSGCVSCLSSSKGRTENCTITFDNCHNYGNISSALYAGVVWGNATYNTTFGPSGDDIPDETMKAMIAFRNDGLTNHATISAQTAHAIADTKVENTFILNATYQDTIGGTYVTVGKLSGTYAVYFDGSTFTVNDNGASNNYIYKVALSVGSIYHYGTGWNVSNGRKLIIIAEEVETGELFKTNAVHAYDYEKAVAHSVITESDVLDYKYDCDGLDVAMVVKDGTLYLIFKEQAHEPDLYVDSNVSTYLYAYNTNEECVGSIEIKQTPS